MYPRTGDKRPILLSKLEAMLTEKVRAAERMVMSTHPAGDKRGTGAQRSLGAANLRLDAHRQVFEAFIQAFTTYRPLLRRIKDEYEEVLDDAIRSSHENIVMRAELAVAEQRKHRAVEEARAEAAANAASLRAELHARLMEAEERAKVTGHSFCAGLCLGGQSLPCLPSQKLVQRTARAVALQKAETREKRLETDMLQLHKALSAAQEELATMKKQNEDLRRLMKEESSFAKVSVRSKGQPLHRQPAKGPVFSPQPSTYCLGMLCRCCGSLRAFSTLSLERSFAER